MTASRLTGILLVAWAAAGFAAEPEFWLGNARIGITLDGHGRLQEIENRLAGETYRVADEGLAVAGTGFAAAERDADMTLTDTGQNRLAYRGRSGPVTFSIEWTLGTDAHFAEKAVTLSFNRDCGVRTIRLGTLAPAAGDVDVVAYRHPDLDWVTDYVWAKHGWDLRRPAGSEPSTTFFGRTPRGGFFAGVEMPFEVHPGTS